MRERLRIATGKLRDAARSVAKQVDRRDILALTGVVFVAWGLGWDEPGGRIAAGASLFYLGVFHPLLVMTLARRED